MSASHRKLARLPLEIFDNLQGGEETLSPEELRSAICDKLKRFRTRHTHHKARSVSTSLKTVGDFLRASPLTVMQALDPLLTFAEVKLLFRRVCFQCCPRPVNCRTLMTRTTGDLQTLLHQAATTVAVEPSLTMQSQPETTVVSNFAIGDRMRYLPTGLPSLDGTGCGGIRLGSVTEVVGRAGAGKTQFALQLVLMAAKYNQGAMYIDTEKKLILERLRDMAARRFSQSSSTYHQPSGTGDQFSYGMSANDSTLNVSGQGQHSSGGDHQELQKELFSFKSAGEVLQNMTVKQPHSTNELLSVLDVAEEEILHRNQQSTFPVRLLIVDSIAAPLKRDFGPSAIPQRAATAFSIAQTLKRLAEQLHLAVIVINQVAIDTTSHHTANRGGPTLRLDQVAVKASLGTSWHHCVSTRMLVDHEVDPHRDDAQLLADGNPCRSLSVVKSNWMPYLTFPFVITPVGIVECRSEMTTQ